MNNLSQLDDQTLRGRIKALEAQEHSGRSNAELDALNREQTRRLSDEDLVSLIRTRAAEGKPIGKLAAAARDRGIDF